MNMVFEKAWLLRIALLAALALAQAACAVSVVPNDEIRGKVVSAETGEPLARVPVGAVAKEQLKGLRGNALVRPDIKTVTDNFGAFRIVKPAGRAFSSGYYIFTYDPILRNAASGGVTIAGQFPTKAELGESRAVKLGFAGAVEFSLKKALRVLEDARIPMRDKEELAATIVLPERHGKYPAIVIRTPYGRKSSFDYAALAREDYVVVIQDVRSRYDSGGERMAFINDGWGKLRDGYDTVEWIARQEWCDGKVGSIGASAMGIVQNLMAGAAPPNLRAQVIIAAAASIYHDSAYPGGIFRSEQVEHWLNSNDWGPRNLEIVKEHPYYDSYWQMLNLNERASLSFPPAIYVGGWYDTFAEGTLGGYSLRRHKAGKSGRDHTYLVMGPWSHQTMFGSAAGEVRLPGNAARDFIPDVILFFDHYLKGEANAFGRGYPRVQYYLMGSLSPEGESRPGNFWVSAGEFPPKAEEAVLFLAPGGELLPKPPEKREHNVDIHVDPASPVRTRGGRNLSITAGPADQREIEDGEKVLSFTSAPISKPMPVVGSVTAQLTLFIDAADADISVRLCDVYPDGTSFLVLDASARMSLPPPHTKPRMIESGKRYPIVVDLGNTAYVFNAGHRIRVDLAGSNYPRFEINPAIAAFGSEKLIAVSLGWGSPSSISFPVCEDVLKNAR